MGEAHGRFFEPTFNQSVKLRQVDPHITSDAGAILLREIDHRLGLTADLGAAIIDPRNQEATRYTQTELLRQHLYTLALGYSHQDDADTMAHDVGMKIAVWDRPGTKVIDERLASQPSDWRLLRRIAGIKPNLEAVRETLPAWVGRHQRAAGKGRKVLCGTLDIDPFPIEVHGKQPGGAYHGYYRQMMYHPVVASFSPGGDYDGPRLGEGFVHAILRRGNAGSAEGGARFVRETIRKSRDLACHLDVRIDAGLVNGEMLDAIDDEDARFVGRIRSNAVLDRLAEPYLSRPPGRPTKDGDEFAIEVGDYQAESWTRPYRLILVVVDLPDPKTGLRELFPRYFFLITNWSHDRRGAWDLVEHYRRRGTFEDRLGEFNGVIGNGLSADTFEANEAALLLKLLAFNLAGIVRGELEDGTGNGWDLKRVQQTVLKVGARVTKHSRRLWVDVARAAGLLWDRVLQRVKRWWQDEAWGRAKPRSRPWVPPPAHAHLELVLRE